MSIPDKALWIIERNSTQPLTLDGIAAACAVSRSHLAHAFGTATGLSVMQYVRARRLSDAARALASGAPHILTVALDAGYNSHEAFTRAFRDRFEETPETVRDRRSLDGLALIDPLKLRPPADIGIERTAFHRFANDARRRSHGAPLLRHDHHDSGTVGAIHGALVRRRPRQGRSHADRRLSPG